MIPVVKSSTLQDASGSIFGKSEKERPRNIICLHIIAWKYSAEIDS